MYKLTNKADRAIGLPAAKRGGIRLEVGESVEVNNEHYKELKRSPITMRHIATGRLVDEKVSTKQDTDNS